MSTETETQNARFVVIGGAVRFTELAGVPGLTGSEAILCDYYQNHGSLEDDLAVLYVRTGPLAGRVIPMHWEGFQYLGDAPALAPPMIVAGDVPDPGPRPPYGVALSSLFPGLSDRAMNALLESVARAGLLLGDKLRGEFREDFHAILGAACGLLDRINASLPETEEERTGRVSFQPVAHPLSVCPADHACCVCGETALPAGHWTRLFPMGAAVEPADPGKPNETPCHKDLKVRCDACRKADRRPDGEKWHGPGLTGLSDQEVAELPLNATHTADGRQIFWDVQ